MQYHSIKNRTFFLLKIGLIKNPRHGSEMGLLMLIISIFHHQMNPATFLNYRRQLLNSGTLNTDGLKEIIAWELMTKIAQAETDKIKEQSESPRQYYLTLYAQSLRAVSGEEIEDIIEDEA